MSLQRGLLVVDPYCTLITLKKKERDSPIRLARCTTSWPQMRGTPRRTRATKACAVTPPPLHEEGDQPMEPTAEMAVLTAEQLAAVMAANRLRSSLRLTSGLPSKGSSCLACVFVPGLEPWKSLRASTCLRRRGVWHSTGALPLPPLAATLRLENGAEP